MSIQAAVRIARDGLIIEEFQHANPATRTLNPAVTPRPGE